MEICSKSSEKRAKIGFSEELRLKDLVNGLQGRGNRQNFNEDIDDVQEIF